MYAAHAVATLRAVCEILGLSWPPRIAIGYTAINLDTTLPGTLDRGMVWNAGYALGRAVGRIFGRR